MKQIKGIPQCINCQQLGHTKNFCTREPICVKCAGKHATVSCSKRPNVTPKCALCQHEGHTANYKGCPVYQKRIKTLNQQTKTIVQRLRETTVPVNPSNSGLSYAQITKNSTQEADNKQKKNTSNEPSISDILVLLTQMKSDINHNIGQLSNRMAKLESKPTAKNTKVNNTKNV